MNSLKNKSGFTLLEIIIVVIIIGVLASLALPKFFSTVEFSRAQEAYSAMATVRGSLERYYLMKNSTYASASTSNIDVGDPLFGQPNAHFTLQITNQGPNTYTIIAARNTLDGGSSASNIQINVTAAGIVRTGMTAFSGIN